MNDGPRELKHSGSQLIHPIGTKFCRAGRKHIETVVDVITWTNSSGECVGIRYVTEHNFMGQTITDRDVVGTTISRGII